MLDAHFHSVYPLARRAAQVHAAAAVVAGALPRADRADLEQEALLAVWRALPRFDPTRASLRTFAERVAANQITSTARAQRAVRRTPVPTEARAHSEQPGSAVEHRIDVERALAVLHDHDRRLARLLADYSPTEASRIARLSRSTVYEAMGRIRIAFVSFGLEPCSAGRRFPKARKGVTELRGPGSGKPYTAVRIVPQSAIARHIETRPTLLREMD